MKERRLKVKKKQEPKLFQTQDVLKSITEQIQKERDAGADLRPGELNLRLAQVIMPKKRVNPLVYAIIPIFIILIILMGGFL